MPKAIENDQEGPDGHSQIQADFAGASSRVGK
ncbi:MAG: hypothetical protein KatS3mg110_2684 [Pirellulaceae bacterium]|nr:MAG: hypothetical protein KatS3mg110_2684 [Pirellulaceae bacterium]